MLCPSHRALGLASVLLITEASCNAQPTSPNKTADATIGTALGTTLFFDDFSHEGLDRSKWNVVVTREQTFNGEQQAYIDSPEVLYTVGESEAVGSSNGALVIHALHKPDRFVLEQNRSFDFISARINTRGKFEFAHGVASARMKLPRGSGLWPAFWILGVGEWPGCGEIDVMECVGDTDWIGVALHGPGYSGETPLVNRHYFPPGHSAAEWHVYSVEWQPDEFLFRIDNRLVYRATRPMVEHYGSWPFDENKFLILNLAIGGAYPAKNNGVTATYYGLPADTIDRIKLGEAKVLIDWVRVEGLPAASRQDR